MIIRLDYPYEQVYSLIKGSVSVATLVDKVDIRKDQYPLTLLVPWEQCWQPS